MLSSATVNQQLAVGETGPVKNKTQWSGFLDAGVHTLKTTDVISIIGSDSGPFVTADAIFLQPIMPDASSSSPPRQPAKRDAVNAKLNEEYFPPREARFVRFTIEQDQRQLKVASTSLKYFPMARTLRWRASVPKPRLPVTSCTPYTTSSKSMTVHMGTPEAGS